MWECIASYGWVLAKENKWVVHCTFVSCSGEGTSYVCVGGGCDPEARVSNACALKNSAIVEAASAWC